MSAEIQPEHGVWLTVLSPDKDPRAEDRLKSSGRLEWAVPEGARDSDLVLLWVAGGKGFSHLLQVDGTPTLPKNDEFGPRQALLRRLELIDPPVPKARLDADSDLSAWSIVRGSFQGAVRAQKESLTQHAVWPALLRLFDSAAPRVAARLRQIAKAEPPTPTSFVRDDLTRAGLATSAELDQVLALSERVHRHRLRRGKSKGKHVSRTSLLHASALVDPEVFDILTQTGLSLTVWRDDLGVDDFPSADDGDPNPRLLLPRETEAIGRGIDYYATEVGLDRKVGALELAAILLYDPRGVLGQRLGTAGVKGLEDLARRILVRSQGPPGPSRDPAADSVVSLIEGDSTAATPWTVSTELHELLCLAARFNRVDERDFPVSFSSLLLALVHASGPWSRWLRCASSSPDVAALLSKKVLSAAEAASLAAQPFREADRKHLLRTTQSALAFLTRAKGYVAELDRAPGVADFIAALVFAPGEHQGDLKDCGIDRVAWARALVQQASSLSLPEAPAFENEFRSVFPDEPVTIWNRPQVDNDRVDGKISERSDCLEARRPALRFARLLAARNVPPPIAVGLFGNWGSGKTFFMGLMRSQIEALAEGARKERKERQSPPAYMERIVQIEFNAWHYQDTNLWASLALHIFDELARQLSPDKADSVEATRMRLHTQMQSSQARLKEAAARRELASQRRVDVARTLEQKESERRTVERQSVRAQAARAWTVLSSRAEFADLKSAAEGLEKQFGVAIFNQGVKDLGALQGEASLLRDRGAALAAAIGQRFRSIPTAIGTILALALLLGGSVGLAYGLGSWLQGLDVNLSSAARITVEIATIFSGIAAWCSRRLQQLRKAVDVVADVEAQLRDEENKLPRDLAVDGLATDLAKLDKEIHQATQEADDAEREIAAATSEIERINRGGLVYDFLQERRAAATYVGQLGLLSTIRRDLNELKSRLASLPTDGKGPIDRVILYIDDLDRCPPKKVVEVLQAVHLLLAFDLFNVVVGVDARWLERSLRRAFAGRGKKQDEAETDAFSPQDYLEKIFQIPYVLAPVQQTGFEKLMAGLLDTRSDWEERKKEEARRRKQEEEDRRRKKEEEARAGNPGGASPTPGPVLGAATVDGSESEPPPVIQTVTEPVPPPEPLPETVLLFEDHEEKFIKGLHEFIDRPRLAKRFVNIYRLLRVRAHEEAAMVTFASLSSDEGYRAALLLLAINVGHHNVAGEILAAVAGAESGTFLKALEAIADDKVPNPLVSPTQRVEIQEVVRKVGALKKDLPVDIAAYRTWAPRVGRFSFYWRPGNELPADW